MPSLKYITDMTDEEVLSLTEDDLKRMIQLKMLEEGIKILVRPEEPRYAEIPKKDMSGFRVKVGYSSEAIYFADRQAAERVAQAVRAEVASLRKSEYVSGPSYERTIVPHDSEPEVTVEEERFFSRGLYDQVKHALEGNRKLKEAYEKQLKEYQEAQQAAAWIRDEVNDRHDAVARKHRDLAATLAKFNEYLQLADDDADQATLFFDKAYRPDRETQEYLSKKTDGQYRMPADPTPAVTPDASAA